MIAVKTDTPDLLLLKWLNELPLLQRYSLVKRYVFMTSGNSADFTDSGEEAWRYFKADLTAADFPLRRVSRLLVVRSLFTFLLESSEAGGLSGSPFPQGNENLVSLDSARYLQLCQRWRTLCQTKLSDAALRDWLLLLQDGAMV